jgi:hypothetical protein
VTGSGVTSANNAAANTTFGPSTATCSGANPHLVGGGAQVTSTATAGNGAAAVQTSFPASTTQWSATGVALIALGAAKNATVTAYAVCAP